MQLFFRLNKNEKKKFENMSKVCQRNKFWLKFVHFTVCREIHIRQNFPPPPQQNRTTFVSISTFYLIASFVKHKTTTDCNERPPRLASCRFRYFTSLRTKCDWRGWVKDVQVWQATCSKFVVWRKQMRDTNGSNPTDTWAKVFCRTVTVEFRV